MPLCFENFTQWPFKALSWDAAPSALQPPVLSGQAPRPEHEDNAEILGTSAPPPVPPYSVAPALAVAFYPGCATELRSGYRPAAPLLLQVGEDDDWTPAEPCRPLAAQDGGAPIHFHAYPRAVHGFAGTPPVPRRAHHPRSAPSAPAHRVSVAAAAACSRRVDVTESACGRHAGARP